MPGEWGQGIAGRGAGTCNALGIDWSKLAAAVDEPVAPADPPIDDAVAGAPPMALRVDGTEGRKEETRLGMLT